LSFSLSLYEFRTERYFSHCYDKISDINNLRKERFNLLMISEISVFGFVIFGLWRGKTLWWQEHMEEAIHLMADRKEKEKERRT
jgi:hypothetical protein